MKLVGELMTDDCQCIGKHDSVRNAAQRMAELQTGAMPICGDRKLVGIISQGDIARQATPEETAELVASISAAPANN